MGFGIGCRPRAVCHDPLSRQDGPASGTAARDRGERAGAHSPLVSRRRSTDGRTFVPARRDGAFGKGACRPGISDGVPQKTHSRCRNDRFCRDTCLIPEDYAGIGRGRYPRCPGWFMGNLREGDARRNSCAADFFAGRKFRRDGDGARWASPRAPGRYGHLGVRAAGDARGAGPKAS